MARLLTLAGFAVEGFVLWAIPLHMTPLLSLLGLGTVGVMVAGLFGPSQVASRLINMVFGGRLPQTLLRHAHGSVHHCFGFGPPEA